MINNHNPNNTVNFILKNLISNAILQASLDFVPTLPLAHIANRQPELIAMSISNADMQLTISLPDPRRLSQDGVALFGDFSPLAQLQITCMSTAMGNGAVVYRSKVHSLLPTNALVAGELYHLPATFFYQRFSAEQSANYQSIVLELHDPAPLNDDHAHVFYRAVIGEVFVPTIGPVINKPPQGILQDLTQQERTTLIDTRALPQGRQQRFSVPLNYVTEAEKAWLIQTCAQVGIHGDGFIHLAPEVTGLAHQLLGMNCYLESVPAFTGQAYDQNQTQLSVYNALPHIAHIVQV